MTIVYIFKSIALLAGMERILTDKMNYLAEKYDIDLFLITYEQSGHPLSFPIHSNIKHIDLDVKFYSTHGHSLIKRLFMYLQMRHLFNNRLKDVISRINPDIIIATTYSYPILDLIIKVSKTSKYILESHVAKSTILKSKDFNNTLIKKISKIYDTYIIKQIKKFDILVTLTNNDKDSWNNITNTLVIPNFSPPQTSDHSNHDVHKIISIGRLHEQKGYDLLIEAWKEVHVKYTNWEMHIYGSGSLKKLLEDKIQEYNLQNCFFIHPPTPNIYQEYNKYSFYVMSSRYEGMPMVLLEAMNNGLPCISFNCPYGPSEIIIKNEDGLLIENGNVSALAEGICYLIEHKDVRIQMGKNARNNVLRYSPERIMKQWYDLFNGLIHK